MNRIVLRHEMCRFRFKCSNQRYRRYGLPEVVRVSLGNTLASGAQSKRFGRLNGNEATFVSLQPAQAEWEMMPMVQHLFSSSNDFCQDGTTV